MATSLAEIRAKLQAQENRNSGNSSNMDNTIYAHWNINEGDTARIRFLPDGNASNPFFWIERNMINLPFSGIDGQVDSKPVTVQVPCMEMWGGTCPVLAEVRPWFKEPSLEEMGRAYWKKRSYLFQGFVRENPLNEESLPENPIRRFIISTQIFNLIKAALMDPELEEMPTDYSAGLDFLVSKTSKGKYADYSTSKWSRKSSALSTEEQSAIEQHGLFNLSEFLPKKPTADDLKIITEMFEASVDGQAYNVEKWGNYYRPRGVQIDTSRSNSASNETVASESEESISTAVVPETSQEDVVVEAPSATSQRAEDILSMIRNRQKTSE